MSIHSFERFPLLFGQSPVHRLDRLTRHLGGAAIWAKREDCNSGIAYGGNKTRKLEYLVADALAKGCDTLVSIGGVQSNHTRQVAAVAARVGLKCVLIQESWVDWPDSVYDKVGNILISRLAGYASTHPDAHLAKYTVACLDAASADPEATRLFLAAAAHLGAWWRQLPSDDPLLT